MTNVRRAVSEMEERKEGRKAGRTEGKERVAAAVGGEGGGGGGGKGMEGVSTRVYLTEDDIDYTPDHHQSVKDIPGVAHVALVAAATHSQERRNREEGR